MANGIVSGSLSRPMLLGGVVVVAVAGIGGVALSPANSVQIIGFTTLICVSLYNLMQQQKTAEMTADKVEEVKAAAAKVAAKVAEVAQVQGLASANATAQLNDIAATGDATHRIVNQQRTDMIEADKISKAEIQSLKDELKDLKRDRGAM
jgi:hypothetical protein